MMIEHTIFARSNTILSDQNACLLSYNIMEGGLVKILLDHLVRSNFVRSYVFLLDHVIGDPDKSPNQRKFFIDQSAHSLV